MITGSMISPLFEPPQPPLAAEAIQRHATTADATFTFPGYHERPYPGTVKPAFPARP
jgi:hypothetical protein